MSIEKKSLKSRYARWYLPKNWQEMLDGVQRLVCLGIATWYLTTTHEWVGCVAILAAGQIDAHKAKTILLNALRGMMEPKE